MKWTSRVTGAAVRLYRICRAMKAACRFPRHTMPTCCVGALLLMAPGLPATAANLYDEIRKDSRLALFTRAVEQAGFTEALQRNGPFILFLPSDKGMTVEGSAFLLHDVLLKPSNAERLVDLIRHHVVPAAQAKLDTKPLANVPTLANAPLSVDRHGDTVIVGGRAIVMDRVEADNGVIYVVDRLLWPRE